MTTLLFVETPQTTNYDAFLERCVSRLPPATPGVTVLVGAEIRASAVLNAVLSALYTAMRRHASRRGFPPTWPVDVVFNRSGDLPAAPAAVYCASGETVPADLRRFAVTQVRFEAAALGEHTPGGAASFAPQCVDTVAVGGTFDHLHDGHKILLSAAVFCARNTVIVGVTGAALLRNKRYASQIQSLSCRVRAVRDFLARVMPPRLAVRLYQINDVCGPTGYLRDIGMLVISDETAQGAAAVNRHRHDLGFPPLTVLSVKVIGGAASAENNWEGKLSSTELRRLEKESLGA